MPGLPTQHNPLLFAHVYTMLRDDTDTKVDTGKGEGDRVYYVQEEGYHLQRQTCTVLIQVAGLDELCCAVNVRRFMQIKRNCEWIKVFTYVDGTLQAEPCPDCKYLTADIVQSDYELLSMPFRINNPNGTIQLVVKTFGPGKKWPDYVFKYDYFNTTDEKAKLLPSRTASKKSFQFRDVVKKSETLMDKLKEVQYGAEDRALREKIVAEEEEKRKAYSLAEMVKRKPAESISIVRRRSVTPEDEGQGVLPDNVASSSSSKRVRVAFDSNSSSTQEQGAGDVSQIHQANNTTRPPAPLMRNGRVLSKAPILDRRW